MQLVFKDPEIYSVCFCALALTQRVVPPSEWDLHVGVLRELRKIGKEVSRTTDGTKIYGLDLPDGKTQHIVQFDKAEVEYLLTSVEYPMWKGAGLEPVVNTRDWLRAILAPSAQLAKVD